MVISRAVRTDQQQFFIVAVFKLRNVAARIKKGYHFQCLKGFHACCQGLLGH
jgi:hypothetical protein